MTITQHTHGTNEHGTPMRGECQSFTRHDRWTRAADGASFLELRHAAGPEDDSPMYTGPWAEGCSCCYLGFSHTVLYHQNATKTLCPECWREFTRVNGLEIVCWECHTKHGGQTDKLKGEKHAP